LTQNKNSDKIIHHLPNFANENLWEVEMKQEKTLSVFDRYLSLFVILCMILGAYLGIKFPSAVNVLSKWSVAQVSIPIAIVLWIMIFPMMVQIDFDRLKEIRNSPTALWITLVVNWLIKPFSMYLIAVLFFRFVFGRFISPDVAQGYIAGAVLLGAAPCTAMVFVWSYLSGGDPNYTLVQVAVNDIVVILAYAPIVKFLLNLNKMVVPYSTVFFSVIIYVVIPVTLGYLFRKWALKNKGEEWLENVFVRDMKNITILGLLLTLIVIFMFQGEKIYNNPKDILLIIIPLVIQTYFIFGIGFVLTRIFKVRYEYAAPATMVGASNFFELAVATAIILFGLGSPATLATVVGVLVEVPVMLSLVAIMKRSRNLYAAYEPKKVFAPEELSSNIAYKDIENDRKDN
jgi:ACR3 family arsenite transporter